MDFKMRIATDIAALNVGFSVNDIYQMIEIPPFDKGDYAFPCFKLAKTFKKSPNNIASELALGFSCPFAELRAEGAYLNFFIDKALFARETIKSIIESGENYGASDFLRGQKIVMDYSSPNIAKPFHVAHVPTTVIGHALYNILKFLGANVTSVNHLGDWGTQFGKMITAYKNWGSETAVEKNGVTELAGLYVRFHDEAEQNPALDDEARAWLLKMEQGDKEALALWRLFRDISLNEYKNNIYKRLGVDFDYYTGESFYNDKMSAVVETLRAKGVLEESGGAMIVNLEEYDMPPCLILRSDGGTLYPTRDIAAAFYRKETFDFDKCLYITCMDQNLHFAQWFKVIEVLGCDWANGLVHIPLGQISFEDGKLSTRKGNVVLLENLLDEAVSKTLAIINEKNPLLENKDEVAEMVGVGAVIFNNMYSSRIKDNVFAWDRALNFEGESGPYVQYTHARACSILDKGVCLLSPRDTADRAELSYDFDSALLDDEYSVALIRLLANYPEKLKECAVKYEPFILSRALIEICQAFNKFYNNNIVLTNDIPLRKARLMLVYSVKTVLKGGLLLLGINAPSRM